MGNFTGIPSKPLAIPKSYDDPFSQIPPINEEDAESPTNRITIRRGDWRKKVLRRYRHCVISEITSLECDAAHIVPFNLCTDDLAPWSGDPANGLLLSKNLHWTYDRLYWSFDPNDRLSVGGPSTGNNESYGPGQDTLQLRIVVRPTKHYLSIHRFLNDSEEEDAAESGVPLGYASVRADSLPFLRIHYAAFLSQYHKELSTRITEAAIREHIKERDSDSQPPFNILDSGSEDCEERFLVLEKGRPLRKAEWYSEQQGRAKWGEEFVKKVGEFEDDMERKDDPDWTPASR